MPKTRLFFFNWQKFSFFQKNCQWQFFGKNENFWQIFWKKYQVFDIQMAIFWRVRFLLSQFEFEADFQRVFTWAKWLSQMIFLNLLHSLPFRTQIKNHNSYFSKKLINRMFMERLQLMIKHFMPNYSLYIIFITNSNLCKKFQK